MWILQKCPAYGPVDGGKSMFCELFVKNSKNSVFSCNDMYSAATYYMELKLL